MIDLIIRVCICMFVQRIVSAYCEQCIQGTTLAYYSNMKRVLSGRKLNETRENEKTGGIKATVLASSQPIIRLWGNNAAEVENYTGVLEIAHCRVRLYTRIGILCICGENLLVELADSETFVCRGKIFSAGYEERKQ